MGLGLSGAYRAAGAQGALADIHDAEAKDAQLKFLNELKLREADNADANGALARDKMTTDAMVEKQKLAFLTKIMSGGADASGSSTAGLSPAILQGLMPRDQPQPTNQALTPSFQPDASASANGLDPQIMGGLSLRSSRPQSQPQMGMAGASAQPQADAGGRRTYSPEERMQADLLLGKGYGDILATPQQRGQEAGAEAAAKDAANPTPTLEGTDYATPTRPDPATANTIDPKLNATPNSIYQQGVLWALTGKLPPAGMAAKGPAALARSAIQLKGSALAAAAGTTLPALQSEYAASSATLKTMLPKYTMLASMADTANQNLQLAIDLSQSVDRTQAPAANRFIQWFQHETGVGQLPNLSGFETAIYSAAREYAKVVSGSYQSAAELSVSGAAAAERLINASQNPQQFAQVADIMQRDMENVKAPMLRQIQGQSENIARFLAVTTGGNVTPGGIAPGLNTTTTPTQQSGQPPPDLLGRMGGLSRVGAAPAAGGNQMKIGRFTVEVGQ